MEMCVDLQAEYARTDDRVCEYVMRFCKCHSRFASKLRRQADENLTPVERSSQHKPPPKRISRIGYILCICTEMHNVEFRNEL